MIAINETFRGEGLPDSPPKFAPGELVRHKRYGYRGVVVSVTGHCQADPAWYMSNQTQPDRNQPWDHVLVDGTGTCTYAAQASLQADPDSGPVDHPLVAHFFSGFEQGRHIRNDKAWPD